MFFSVYFQVHSALLALMGAIQIFLWNVIIKIVALCTNRSSGSVRKGVLLYTYIFLNPITISWIAS